MGRFDTLALHTYLFARRMKAEGTEISESLSQDVFDLFVADIERALREMGIGDTTVPKRKKKMVRSFYGQIDDFDPAIDAGDQPQLAEKVKLRYLGSSEADPGDLADYILEQEKFLADQSIETMLMGELIWSEQKRD